MKRTYNSFSVLQATAAIVGFAIILWSFGLPSLRLAEAANVTTLSNTLSNSAPGVASNHTISFVTPSGIASGTSITIDFSDGPFDIGSVDETDIDVLDDTNDLIVAASCGGGEEVGASFAGTILTLEICLDDGPDIAVNGTTTIKIGTHATFGGDTGDADAQIVNPGVGSHKIGVNAGSDIGETQVTIVPVVTVTASVDTLFTFSVSGVGGGETVNTADVTDGTSTPILIAFGELEANTASTAAQDLTVDTNAANGFVVTVTADGQLRSSTGADIDGFRNGNFDATPVQWEGPTPTLGLEDTYGHWGITSDDPTLSESLTDIFNTGAGGDRFVSASTTPVEVFRHNGPTNGSVTAVTGQGTTRVGYKVQISALQEAADDYTATLTYVATPVF